MNFDEALNYLLSLGHETLAIKLGLANIERLLKLLDEPQRRFAAVQIAGTNGKGSTAAMLARITSAARIKTGLYTSPHLVSITERIRINDVDISRADFARAATTVRSAAEEIARATGALPTFFEQVTAIALVHFRDAGVELAVLETGLGGRLDATTAARASIVAITPIAYDHQEYLGGTLAEIAAEKAAIIRPGVRAAVIAPQTPEAEAVISERCRVCEVMPRHVVNNIEILGECDEGRLRARFTLAIGADVTTGEDIVACLSLRGRHQLTNAAVAVALAEELRAAGFNISRAHIIEGLETAAHAGRLEQDASHMPRILFDGAHNAAGARALRAYLDEFVRAPVTLIFGAMRDKPLAEICEMLFPAAARLILTQPDNPRSATVDELVRAVPVSLSSSTIAFAPSVADALALARAQTEQGGLICVTGSLYLVGEVKNILAQTRRKP